MFRTYMNGASFSHQLISLNLNVRIKDSHENNLQKTQWSLIQLANTLLDFDEQQLLFLHFQSFSFSWQDFVASLLDVNSQFKLSCKFVKSLFSLFFGSSYLCFQLWLLLTLSWIQKRSIDSKMKHVLMISQIISFTHLSATWDLMKSEWLLQWFSASLFFHLYSLAFVWQVLTSI